MNSVPTLPPLASAHDCLGRRETILLVDDFAPLCDLVARHLVSSGYRVLIANNAMEAKKLVGSSAGRTIDLLLTDLEMPGMRGDELAVWFLAERPGTPTILMTHRTENLRLRGEIRCLAKPFSLADLGSAVRWALTLRNVSATVHEFDTIAA